VVTSFWEKIDRLQLWHAQLTDKSWLQPLKPTRWMVIFIVLAGLIAAGMNGYVRYWQYEVWEQNNQLFYLDDGTPLFTTTDAPYFLGLAQSLKRDGNIRSFNERRQYPRIKDNYKEHPPSSNLRNAPLLSVILSMIATDSSPKSLLEAGHRLIPITAILTALMIVFAFGAAGYWLEGSIAAAGGGLSLAYLPRSGAGRIDTDQLNLGFFYLITGLMIWAARVKSYRASLVLAALAGAVFWLFDWWYSKPFFGWAFFVGFIWLSLVCRSDMRRLALQAVLFLALSGLPLKALGILGDSAYLTDVLLFEGLIFPNTFETITELSHVPFADILVRISGSVWLGIISLVGLGLWALRHPALAIVFGPAAAFALLNFAIGNRAIFYSAPMLWFGFGWLLFLAFRLAEQYLNQPRLQLATLPIAAIIGFLSVWGASPTSHLQAPSFNKQTITHFQKLKALVPDSDAAIATWWDYGYMSMLINGRPTLHDGGSQTSPTTHFIANNLLRRSQKEAAFELKMLGNTGYEGVIVHRLSDKEDSTKARSDDTVIYLVLTQDMTRWMPSISKVGLFDIKAGKPYKFDGVKQGYQLRYNDLKCTPTDITQEFVCNGDRLNLVSGRLGNKAILDGMAVSRDGRQTGGRKFSKTNTPFVLHSEVGAAANSNLLLHRDLYFSVFHQLFYLNRADPKHFEMVYDGFPDMRVFKVL
jgi:dolichyl-diphosphooligosaccharide--protein glycosyltransferase